jgi:hypothetical protein
VLQKRVIRPSGDGLGNARPEEQARQEPAEQLAGIKPVKGDPEARGEEVALLAQQPSEFFLD